ncbi:zinc ribbon domain-containing protein [Terrilactibacillus tamarindi]|nr:zinc-ribbon domain-containing protein [Terrilactibacillus tamarindi]
MARHCTECGHTLPDNAQFCTNCGKKIGEEIRQESASQEVIPQPPASRISPERQESRKTFRIKKRVYIPILAAVIVLITLFYVGKSLTNPERTVDAFEKAVGDEDVASLVKLIHTNEQSKVNESQVKAMLALFKKEPQVYTSVIHSLEIAAKEKDSQSVNSSLYYLKAKGKKFLIYDKYQITTQALHPKVKTNLQGMEVGIQGLKMSEKASKASSESPQTVVLDAVIPGIYTVYGKSDHLNMAKQLSVRSAQASADFSGVYIPIHSNIMNAELYVNNEATGKKISEIGEWGPFKKDDEPSFYAVYTVNGKSIQTDRVDISNDDSDYDSVTLESAEYDGIDLIFAEKEDSSEFYDLDPNDNQANTELLETYFDGYFSDLASAVNYGEADEFGDYFETGSAFYKEQTDAVKEFYDKGIEESINNYDINRVSAGEDGTYTVNVSENWSETIPKEDDEFSYEDKDFSIETNYKVKEVAPGEIKIVGGELVKRTTD